VTGAEKRQHQRFALQIPVSLYVGPERITLPATLLDLSRGGCFLETSTPVELGKVSTVTFVVRPTKKCTARGKVVRLHSGRGFGVQFLEANESFREFVADLASLRPALRAEFLANVLTPEMRIV
jgi:hypothetical protein